MAQTNTLATLDGWFKEVYADTYLKLIPENTKLYQKAKFKSGYKVGEAYHVPAMLTNNHGITFASSSSGAYTLNNSIAITTKDASVDPNPKSMRAEISTIAAKRATASKGAFGSIVGINVENLMSSMGKYLELSCLYGQTGYGTTSTSVNTDSTTTVVTFTAASWAGGIWSGMENAQVQFYNSTSLVSSGSDSIFTISAVDIANRKLTVTGTSTGISALDTAAQATSAALTIYFNGEYSNNFAGLDKITTNTGSLFGINATTYNLWKGNSYASGGALTLEKVLKSIVPAINKGLEGDVTAYVNPDVWAELNADEAALRRYGADVKNAKNSSQAIQYNYQMGTITVEAHPFVKVGEGFVFPEDKLCRIGASEITFDNNIGSDRSDGGGQYFLRLANAEGFEIRAFDSEALFCEAPGYLTKITGITVS